MGALRRQPPKMLSLFIMRKSLKVLPAKAKKYHIINRQQSTNNQEEYHE